MLNRKPRRSDIAVAVLAAVIAAGLAACSSDASLTGPSAAAAADSASTVVLSQTFDEVEVGGQRVVTFGLPRQGTLALTVRWNDQGNSVVAVLIGGSCPNNLDGAADCVVRRSVERQGKEGREGRIDYPDAAGTYRVLVENEGPGVESIRLTAELEAAAPNVPTPPTPYPTSRPERTPAPRGSGRP